MTLTFYRDYQELFANCSIYYDLSLTSTSLLQDLIGGYHATNSGVVFTGTDRFGKLNKTMVFDGADSMSFTLPTTTLTSVTLAMWLNISSSGAANQFIYSYMINSSYEVKGFRLNMDNFILSFSGLNSNWAPASYTLTASQKDVWVFVVGTFSNTDQINRIYVSNPTSNTISQSGYTSWGVNIATPSAGTGHIGKAPAGWGIGDRYYTGGMGEVMVWLNRSLSASEVAMLYNLTKSKYLFPVQSGIRGVE